MSKIAQRNRNERMCRWRGERRQVNILKEATFARVIPRVTCFLSEMLIAYWSFYHTIIYFRFLMDSGDKQLRSAQSALEHEHRVQERSLKAQAYSAWLDQAYRELSKIRLVYRAEKSKK